ncbi:MAG: futalosine hydrolase [Candidatus Poribacteria bacterium]|nr:futalosine hydrolase [Candidatus Poribacteria bacterium]
MSADPILLCATEGEASRLIASIQSVTRTERQGFVQFAGMIEGVAVRVIVAGIGVVNTAHALTVALNERRAGVVLQFGIGGAYLGGGLRIGEVACASEEIYGDLGVITPDGWKPSDEFGFPVVASDPPRFNRFPLNGGLVESVAALTGARVGSFLTLSQVTGVQSVGDELCRRFGSICENMEGAAAAHVCAIYETPFLELRGISNLVVDRDRSAWRIGDAASAVTDATLKTVTHLEGWMT